MKHFTYFLLSVSFLTVTAQNSWKKGTLKLSTGEALEVLFKNANYSDNPTEITYKRNEESPEQIGTTENIQSFQVGENTKYIKATVQIDISSDKFNNLSRQRAPEFEEQTIFLEVMVQGEASLYRYESSGRIRYFFSISENPIRPLIYKNYKVRNNETGGVEIRTNSQFRQQLANSVNNDNTSVSLIEKTKYQAKSLFGYFSKFNEGENTPVTYFETRTEKKDLLSIRAKAGLNFQSLTINTGTVQSRTLGTYSISGDFGKATAPRLALEAEMKIPYGAKLWAVFLEATYQNYEETALLQTFVEQNATATYNSIDISIGIRRYYPLNDEFRVWLDLFGTIGVADGNSIIDFDSFPNSNAQAGINLGCTSGLIYKDRYLVEGKYNFGRSPYIVATSFTSYSISLGYVIYK